MIEIQIQFNEEHVGNMLSSTQYLIEAAVGEQLPVAAKSTLIGMVKQKYYRQMTRGKRDAIESLQAREPAEVVRFMGLRKYTAEWWSAVVRLSHSNKRIKTSYLHLIGWHNGVHGTEAHVLKVMDKKGVLVLDLDEKASRKLDNDYEIVLNIEELDLGMPEEVMLPGLPSPEAVREEIQRVALAKKKTQESRKKPRQPQTPPKASTAPQGPPTSSSGAVSGQSAGAFVRHGELVMGPKKKTQKKHILSPEYTTDPLISPETAAELLGISTEIVAEGNAALSAQEIQTLKDKRRKTKKDKEALLRDSMRKRKEESEW